MSSRHENAKIIEGYFADVFARDKAILCKLSEAAPILQQMGLYNHFVKGNMENGATWHAIRGMARTDALLMSHVQFFENFQKLPDEVKSLFPKRLYNQLRNLRNKVAHCVEDLNNKEAYEILAKSLAKDSPAPQDYKDIRDTISTTETINPHIKSEINGAITDIICALNDYGFTQKLSFEVGRNLEFRLASKSFGFNLCQAIETFKPLSLLTQKNYSQRLNLPDRESLIRYRNFTMHHNHQEANIDDASQEYMNAVKLGLLSEPIHQFLAGNPLKSIAPWSAQQFMKDALGQCILRDNHKSEILAEMIKHWETIPPKERKAWKEHSFINEYAEIARDFKGKDFDEEVACLCEEQGYINIIAHHHLSKSQAQHHI